VHCSAIDDMRTAGGLVGVPYLLCLLGAAELAHGRLPEARAALTEASALVAVNGNALYAAEGLRLGGEIALAADANAQRDAAEAAFTAALALAGRQGSRALELRAATSLARLWALGGEEHRAAEWLGPRVDAFDEGLDTADLVAARGLVAAWRACV